MASGHPIKCLVIAPNWIGDAVMSLSLLMGLKSKHSDTGVSIEVLAPPVTAPVYEASGLVDQTHVEPFVHGKLQWSLRRQVSAQIRHRGFDQAIILPNSLKSALVPWLARIPVRIGYDGELRSLVLTQPLKKPSKVNKPPMIEWYGALGDLSSSQLEFPAFNLDQNHASTLCEQFQLVPGFLAVAPGAEYGPAKRWPAKQVAEVITHFLTMKPNQQAVLLGGPKDVGFCGEITQSVPAGVSGRVKVLAGQTKLIEAIMLLGKAGVLLTNDSGLMHVGAALGLPLHAVYGSSSPHHTPPLSKKAVVHYLGLECSPCYERQCPLGHTRCLVDLKAEQVIQQMALGPGGVS